MAKEIIKNASLLVHSLQLASNTNQIEFSGEAEAIETTNFASGGAKEYVQGLRTSTLSCELMLESAADPQETLEALLDDETDAAFTVTKTYPPVAGDVAWFAQVVAMALSMKAVVGQLWSGSMKFGNRARAVRGFVLEYNAARSTTGTSASLTMPAIGATEKLVLAVHVLSATGTTPTLDLVIESDADNTYASAATRATIPQFDAVGSYYVVIDGPITDTEYRVSATVGGTLPAFKYLVAIATAPF